MDACHLRTDEGVSICHYRLIMENERGREGEEKKEEGERGRGTVMRGKRKRKKRKRRGEECP